MKVLLLLFTLIFTLFTSPVYATDPPKPCVDSTEFGPCPAGLNEIEGTVGNVLSVVVGLGFIAMLMVLLVAGIKYLTSGGEPKALQAAHYTLSWAVLGLIFMAVAWIILQLIASFTGTPITVFNIKVLCGNPTDSAKWFCGTP